jgi:hypothetical protein
MSRILIQVLMAVVLAFNGPVGFVAAVEAAEPPPATAAHAHCPDMAAQNSTMQHSDELQQGATHQGQTSDACCKVGSCHCGSMTLSARTILPVSRVLVLVSHVGTGHVSAPPSPTPTRHFRPPIV